MFDVLESSHREIITIFYPITCILILFELTIQRRNFKFRFSSFSKQVNNPLLCRWQNRLGRVSKRIPFGLGSGFQTNL